MTAYILMISKKGGYIFHSVHSDANVANEWAKCKQTDGEDTAILLLENIADCIDELQKILEK